MPRYTFEDENGEQSIVEMKMAELDDFKEKNPNLHQVFTSPQTVDPILLGRERPPADFQKYVIDKIKAKTPGHSMDSTRWPTSREW